jgi:hypothetical protein
MYHHDKVLRKPNIKRGYSRLKRFILGSGHKYWTGRYFSQMAKTILLRDGSKSTDFQTFNGNIYKLTICIMIKANHLVLDPVKLYHDP